MDQQHENAIETALRLAADEPAHRPDFYTLLLASPVYILGHSDGASGAGMLEAGEKISIQNWVRNDGSPVIPFFTSLAALQRGIEQEAAYLMLPARSLFEVTRGSSLVLNPRSPYGKQFLPDEIEALLSEGVNRRAERRVTQNATEVLLGQPATWPSQMVDALTALFSRRSNVKAAYLTLMSNPSRDEKPHLVVGIEADGDIDRIIREAGAVAGDTAPDGGPVDLMRVERGERGLSRYLIRETRPFYERRWGSRIKSFLGIGRA